jgi:hypothetical protein
MHHTLPHQPHVVDGGNLNTRGDSVSAPPEITETGWTDQMTLHSATSITAVQRRWVRDPPTVDDGP